MKIIGTTSTGFIIEASSRDVFNLIGFYSEYSDNKPGLKPGDSICISKMYQQLYGLSNNQKTIDGVIKTLTDVIGLLLVTNPVMKELLPADRGEES